MQYPCVNEILILIWYLFVFDFLKKQVCPIGIDLGARHLKIAQLGHDNNGLYLHASGCENAPENIEIGSGNWQRWVAETTKDIIKYNGFKGKEVVASIFSDDLFIEQIKISKSPGINLEDAVPQKIGQKLPFNIKNAIIKHVVTNNSNNGDIDVLVMAAEKEKINRHLAIYEKAGLDIKGINVWPVIMTNCYAHFFGRRQADTGAVAMLMDIGANSSDIVICKGKDLLFARAIPIGCCQFDQAGKIDEMIIEAEACCHYFESLASRSHIQRLLLLSGRGADDKICQKVSELAKRMKIPAQIGDVLAAIEIKADRIGNIDRRNQNVDWTTAFGLSLTSLELQ